MVVLLVLGHVCELPAYTGLIEAHSSEGRSADGHGHESEVSCDPVDAVSNTAPVFQVMNPILETVQALPAASAVPSGPIPSSSVNRPTRLPSRPPLFVLYASLLI